MVRLLSFFLAFFPIKTLQMMKTTLSEELGNLPPLPKPPRGVPICLDEHVEERTGMLFIEHLVQQAARVEAKQMEPAYSNCKGVYRLRIVIRNSKLSWTAVGRLLDEFLTTRLSWSIIFEPRPHDDEEMVGLPKRKSHQNLIETAMAETTSNTRKKTDTVVLQYRRGYAAGLLDSIEAIQHPVKVGQEHHCPTLHYFFEDRSFIGLTISSFAGAFFEFKATGIPFQPVTNRRWTYVDNSWDGCSDNLHQLECYFLRGTSCDLSKHEWNIMTASRKNLGWGVPGAILERDKAGGFNSTAITKYRRISNSMFHRYPGGDWRSDLDRMTSGAVAVHASENREFVSTLKNKVLATHATFLQTFLRPNFRTRAEIALRVARWKAENPNWICGNETAIPCIAMHVRHGDKLTHYWMNASTLAGKNMAIANAREFNHSLWDYTDLALRRHADVDKQSNFLENKHQSENVQFSVTSEPLLKIFLMTDDRDVVTEASIVEKSRNVKFYWVKPGRPLQSTSEINLRSNIGTFNHEKRCRRDRRFCALDYARDPLTGANVGSEELLQFLVAFTIMVEGDIFVAASASSHFTRLILAWICSARENGCPVVDFLAHHRNGATGKPMHRNRLYSPHGRTSVLRTPHRHFNP